MARCRAAFQIDYSCRRRGDKWLVAMNKWQHITDMEVCKGDPSVVLLGQSMELNDR
jgi:hypothetical protein